MISETRITNRTTGSARRIQSDPLDQQRAGDKATTIDLGQSGPGGGQTFNLKDHQIAVKDTPESVEKATGTFGVVVSNQEQVKKVNQAISEISVELDKQHQTQNKDLNKNNNQKNEVIPMNTPSGAGKAGSNGGFLAAIVGFIQSLVGTIFGGQ